MRWVPGQRRLQLGARLAAHDDEGGADRRTTAVEALLAVVGVALRVLVWFLLCRAVADSTVGAAAVAGAVLADVATLVPLSLWMAHRRRLSVLEAALGVGAVLWLQLSGNLVLPESAEGRGIAMLAFLAILILKVARWARAVFHDDDDAAG